MIGTITDPTAAVAIGEAFGMASRDARVRLERASRREAQGQSAMREDTITDDLMDAFDESIRDRLREVSAHLSSSGSNVRVEFEATKAPQGDETRSGLDVGIRAIIETPDYSVEKAIIVQCKRM